MAEQEREKERLQEQEIDPRLYYDYEGLIIKERLEREHVYLLPRVIKPEMYAKGGHVLGDLRVFERYTVAPLSSLTCSFLRLEPGSRTELTRMVPSLIAYVVEGAGQCIQDGNSHSLAPGDVVVVPPYTAYQFQAAQDDCFRAWLPQVRLWHLLGLLWQEPLELKTVPEGTQPIRDNTGRISGFVVPQGTLGLKHDLVVQAGADAKRQQFFQGRRAVQLPPEGTTKYHYFLRRLAEENDLENQAPRVIRGGEQTWEETRQGKMKVYIGYWTEIAARALDLILYEVEHGGHTGKHRHIFEELLLVVNGKGHDVHEGASYPWEAGDLICIPPMTTHQHFNDGQQPACLLSVWPRQLTHEFLGGIEHISDASSWAA